MNGGKVEFRRRPVDARALAVAARERWRVRAARAGRRIAVRWRCGDAVADVDPTRVSQALDNLIANALEHGGGQITLEGVRHGDRLDLVVRDTGTTAIQRLRDHADPRRGHGLRITRRLARLSGGELRVRGGGGGTVAALILPLAPASPTRSAPRTAGEKQGPRRRLCLRRVVCAGLSAAVAGSSQAPEESFGPLRPVVVTSAPLERATTVDRKELRDALAERQVPKAFVPPDALGIPEEALGRKLAVPLPAGSYLTAAAFQAPSVGPRGGPPKGTTPVEITVTGAGALATTRTNQGDQVDVVVSGDAAPGPGAGRTYIAASDVSLLALREARAEPGLEADRWIATLALTRDEALRLIRAESVGAQVRLLAG